MLYFWGELIQVYIFVPHPTLLPKQSKKQTASRILGDVVFFNAEAQETGAMQQTKASGPQKRGWEALQP